MTLRLFVTRRYGAFIGLLAVVGTTGSGCARRSDGSAEHDGPVVCYVSVDEEFARGVLGAFTSETGIELRSLFDQEANKTTGLVNRLRAEKASPRADVFWSSELFNTMNLAREGLLQPYRSPAANDIPSRYRDPGGYWTATALRGRVLAYNTNRIKGGALPTRWRDLAQAKWASKLAIANPISGTTRGHVAAMFALWGPEQGKAFLTSLREGGALVVDGNSMAVRLVGRGERDWCATDTDDVWVAQERGEPVDLIYPDMGDGGTLLIPCSAALVAGARHEVGARRLIDYLVSAKVERLLAESDSRNIPVRPALREELGITKPAETKIGYARIAEAMDQAVNAAREILLR